VPTGATAGRWIVERYELLDEVRRGPADVVWHGRDRPLDRAVTVREVLLPDVLDDAEQAALAAKVLREARAAAHLSHPAAVAVLDAVVDDDRPFVVNELVDAPTLEDVVATQGPLAPERAATIGVAVLDALGAAHAGGLVHRDVRPSNVLVPPSGGARLAAFGLGALVDDPKVVTSGAGPAPLYLAPEQTGTAGASAASDLWSLGATLYFAVEGVPPFEGEEPAEMLDAIVGREPRPPQRTGPLQAVLDVLLVKDPADRADEAAVRPLLLAAAGPDAPPEPERLPDVAPSANGAAANLSTSTATNGAEPAANGAEPAANGSDPAATSAIATLVTGPPRREPWFFDIPVETVPPPPRSEPAPAVERHPWPDQTRRLPKGFWIAVLAAGIGAVLIALVTTNGRILSPDRPSQEDAEGPSDPSEWVTYTDGATGFSIRHPREWGVRRSGSVTDFVDPERPGTYLRVDHVQPPAASPVEAWRSQERSISARYANYRRLQLEPTTFQDHPAAVWEFTYTDSGVELHALDLGFVTDRYGFAVNFQTRAADWSRLAPVFEAFKAGFRPPA
jgi:serine/threonine protein kinase